jgi:hypothetical protein
LTPFCRTNAVLLGSAAGVVALFAAGMVQLQYWRRSGQTCRQCPLISTSPLNLVGRVVRGVLNARGRSVSAERRRSRHIPTPQPNPCRCLRCHGTRLPVEPPIRALPLLTC